MTNTDKQDEANQMQFAEIAKQLRQPQGEHAKAVGERMNEGNLQINLHSIKKLNISLNDRILEIGMGNGFFVKNILTQNDTVVYAGCDFSEAMVREAELINAQYLKTKRAAFFKTEAKRLPFGDNSYNKIFTVNTIYFWEQPELVLKELARVLEPGGSLIIALRPKSVMDHFPITKFGFNTFSALEVSALLAQNNFKVIDLAEEEEEALEFFGEKLKNEFMIVSATKI
ncbi:MAG TPA: class I SAM-dependent methyltransferase [Bacteroidia bacterium]|nr:class I SAM-dependent methyltransferase [Bacteroidia bacterium]